MGNRAVLELNDLDIYVHWNGGVESVKAFLDYAKTVKVRTDDYAAARLCQIIGNFFDYGIEPKPWSEPLSLGIGPKGTYGDVGDNGRFIIEDWTIVAWEPSCWFNADHERLIVGDVPTNFAEWDRAYGWDQDYYTNVLEGVIEANKSTLGLYIEAHALRDEPVAPSMN